MQYVNIIFNIIELNKCKLHKTEINKRDKYVEHEVRDSCCLHKVSLWHRGSYLYVIKIPVNINEIQNIDGSLNHSSIIIDYYLIFTPK